MSLYASTGTERRPGDLRPALTPRRVRRPDLRNTPRRFTPAAVAVTTPTQILPPVALEEALRAAAAQDVTATWHTYRPLRTTASRLRHLARRALMMSTYAVGAASFLLAGVLWMDVTDGKAVFGWAVWSTILAVVAFGVTWALYLPAGTVGSWLRAKASRIRARMATFVLGLALTTRTWGAR